MVTSINTHNKSAYLQNSSSYRPTLVDTSVEHVPTFFFEEPELESNFKVHLLDETLI
jgi:hypothetical protein